MLLRTDPTTTLDLVEGGEAQEIVASDDVVAFLRDERVVDAISIGSLRWLVTPRTRVGSVRIGDLVVRVQPKLPVGQIVFLLGYASNPRWSPSVVDLAPHDEFVPAVADAFVRQAEAALRSGAIQGYRETDDELPVLRGRLREQEQIRRRFGTPLPLLVRYDEFTTDIAENRILRTAAEHLLRVPGLRADTVPRLRSVRANLADVAVVTPGAPLPRWQPSRLNDRYLPALGLAALVLRRSSFSHHAPIVGTVSTNGFMVEMSTVFEEFLAVALGEALASYGGRCVPQRPDELDEDGHVRMKYDLLWERNGKATAVIDAKYKAEKLAGYPNADVYQMLAYCTALGLPVGHLVYAKGSEEPLIHRVRNVDVGVHVHALDLALAPEALLAQVRALADRIAALA